MSSGHGSGWTGGVSASVSCADVPESPTTVPSGTAPGCHVTVADASLVATAPAWPGCAVDESGVGGGTGAAAMAVVGAAVADCEPTVLVAVTTTSIVAPMSPGVRRYAVPVAPVIAVQTPVASQRCH